MLAAALLIAALLGSAVQDESASHCPIELRVSPLVELWLEVRALTEERGQPADQDLGAAVAAMRALEAALGSAAGFGLVEGNLVDVADSAALARTFAELPEVWRSRTGGEVALRAPCVAVAEALSALEPRWRERHWPAREAALTQAQVRLASTLDAKGPAIYERLQQTLGLQSADVAIPVYLVTRAPWPGAFTHRSAAGEGVSFVALEAGLSDLVEVVVHESLHALDLATPGPESLFVELRSELAAAGLSPSAVRDWVHTLFFLEAAACVRAVVDPEHVDYGDRTTLYARSQPQVDVERPLWRSYTAGELERAKLVAAIVAAARDAK